MKQYNPQTKSYMHVCYVDPSIGKLGIVGIGDNSAEAIFNAICSAEANCVGETQIDSWLEDLDMYYITADAYNEIAKAGIADCRQAGNVIMLATQKSK